MNRSAVARRERLRPEVVAGWAAAAATVLVVYVAVVLGGGALLGRTDSPSLGLSILATVLVASLARRVRGRVEEGTARRRGQDRQSPYDVLAEFSRVAASDVGEQAPPVIARMLVQGLGLEWAQVWVLVGGELRLVATHPVTDAVDETVPALYESRPQRGMRTVTVARAGHALGVLRVKEHEDRPLSPVADRLLGGLAAQAGMVLESAQLREELSVRFRDLTARQRDLRRARESLVTTQDLERRRLERDIHDGAQQQLVALAINLKLAAVLSEVDPDRARTVLQEQLSATGDAIRTLSDLTDGLLPPTLARAGIAAALTEATVANPVAVRVHDAGIPRLPGGVEATLYFCALEAVQNATKHSGGTRIDLWLGADAGGVSIRVEDDGSGIPSVSTEGSGLTNLRERVAAIGGRLEVGERPGGGTTVGVHVPESPSTAAPSVSTEGS